MKGSSKLMNKDFGFSGILGGKQSSNPGSYFYHFVYDSMILFLMCFDAMRLNRIFIFFSDFYNWNRIKVRYCDGSSFTGDIEAVDPVIHQTVTIKHLKGVHCFFFFAF